MTKKYVVASRTILSRRLDMPSICPRARRFTAHHTIMRKANVSLTKKRSITVIRIPRNKEQNGPYTSESEVLMNSAARHRWKVQSLNPSSGMSGNFNAFEIRSCLHRVARGDVQGSNEIRIAPNIPKENCAKVMKARRPPIHRFFPRTA